MKNPQRIHGLDLLRFFAITAVLLLHSSEIILDMPESLRGIFAFGWSGVDLFFVLSGFLIGRQVFLEPEERSTKDKLKVFWMKRWFRTLPLYYVALIAYVVIKPMLGFPFKDWNWSFLIFTQNYFEPKDFIQTWSLCIEEQFYLVFPILAFVFNLRFKHPLIWLIPMLISLFMRGWAWWSGDLSTLNKPQMAYALDFLTHMRLDGLSCGVFLAATFDTWKNWGKNNRFLLGSVGLISLIITCNLSGHFAMGFSAVYVYTFISLSFASLLIALHDIRLPELVYLPVLKIAEWSYGIYLWNNLFMRFILKIQLPAPWWVRMAFFFFLSIGSAFVTFHVVEKTCLKIRNLKLKKYA